ncbi:hypothetical protein Bra5_CH01830 [Rhizobium phaseoli Brasil 5]|nr:hypothetical protein IE4803_CH01821 [Rhizobium etli bv. phaseoli str. IE4803]ARM12067.1 hypothetical protein Bra5_CH01830 [Rhizobium phaseoli Brasil 5]
MNLGRFDFHRDAYLRYHQSRRDASPFGADGLSFPIFVFHAKKRSQPTTIY